MEDNVEKKGKVNIVAIIVVIIFLAIFIVSSIKVMKYLNDNISNSDIMADLSEDILVSNEVKEDSVEESYKIDFDSLKEKNPDTVGFIKVNGTDVSFVVVQGKDNDYYLHHNFNKEANSAGWIFLDYRNKLDGNDKNTIIYGHNMRTDTMFGTLTRILSDEWIYNMDNRIVTFVTEKGTSYYKVFSVYQIEDEAYYITTDFKEDKDFEKYLDTIKKRSKYDFKEEVDTSDQVLTLSTCANNSAYRIVLHAKKIK